MNSKIIQAADTKQLARLLSPADDSLSIYEGADLAVILQHQLQAPIAEELSSPVCGAEGRSQALENFDPSLRTFAHLLNHPNPPLDLLIRTKDFAKSCRANPDLLPPAVATLLYYAAIAAARLRYDEKITELDDAGLKTGVEWAIAQPWLDASLQPLFRQILDHLAGE